MQKNPKTNLYILYKKTTEFSIYGIKNMIKDGGMGSSEMLPFC